MSARVTAEWLSEVLLRQDPLAAWPGTGAPGESDYRREAQLAAADLGQILGIGHARTVVAHAPDRVHPGFYRALADASAGDELTGRLGRIAREVWDCYAVRLGLERHAGEALAEPLPEVPPSDVLIRDDAALADWLRSTEGHLGAEVGIPGGPPSPAAVGLLFAFPQLVDAYLEASAERRASLRLTFSRFARVCHRLSSFAVFQSRLLDGPRAEEGLRRCLAAESLLDLHLDWRDELLLLRDVRRAAAARGLPFEEELARAADASSARTARFLRGLLD